MKVVVLVDVIEMVPTKRRTDRIEVEVESDTTFADVIEKVKADFHRNPDNKGLTPDLHVALAEPDLTGPEQIEPKPGELSSVAFDAIPPLRFRS